MTADADERTESEGGHGRERDGADADFGIDGQRVVTFLQWGALFAFAVLVLIAGAGLYSSLGSIIDVWVADRYQPIARAGVNFALLCAAIGGVVGTLRRLRR